MSTAENKGIALRFAQVWGKGSLSLVDELAAPNIRVSYPLLPAPVEGAAAFKSVLTAVRAGLADLEIEVGDPIAEGDRVAATWTLRGTHKGDLLGIPASGKHVSWTGITIYRIERGRVVDERGEEDGLGLLRQVGALPA